MVTVPVGAAMSINLSSPIIYTPQGQKGSLAVEYTRLSKIEPESQSLERQSENIGKYAQKHGINIIKRFSELASARHRFTRKGFKEFINFIKANPDVKIVLIDSIDRLTRNFGDWEEFWDLVKLCKLTVVFVTENKAVDYRISAFEKFTLDIFVALASLYVNQNAEKVKAGLDKRAMDGSRNGVLPFGFKNRNGKAVVMHKEAEMIRTMFKLYAEGTYSLTSLSQKLFDLGYKYNHPSGMIPKNTIRGMLMNFAYIGKHRAGEKQELISGNYDSIIEEDLFYAVQKGLKMYELTRRRDNYLYNQLITCGECGFTVVGDKKDKPNRRYIYYKCSLHDKNCSQKAATREESIDADIKRYLKEIRLSLIPQEIFDEVKKLAQSELTRKIGDKKRVLTRLYKLELNHANMIGQYEISDESIDFEYQAIEERNHKLRDEIDDLESKVAEVSDSLNNMRNKTLYDIYCTLPDSKKKKVLNLVKNKLTLNDKKLKMTFKPAFRKIRHR